MKTTHHAEIRLQQRGISEWAVEQVLQHGDCIHKQGMRFCYMTKKMAERYYAPNDRKELKDLIVLISQDMTFVTAYRNPNALHAIKCKNKRLSKAPKYFHLNKWIAQTSKDKREMAA